MKKCRDCKQLNVREFNGIAISKRCTSCREKKNIEKKIKHETTKGFQEKFLNKLHKKAWKTWSKHIRLREADDFGMVKCYTCTAIKHWKELQAGHYWHRRLDFDRRNIHPQCKQCNGPAKGNLAEYGARLTEEIGLEEMQKLRLDANTTKNTYSIEFYQEIIAKYETNDSTK